LTEATGSRKKEETSQKRVGDICEEKKARKNKRTLLGAKGKYENHTENGWTKVGIRGIGGSEEGTKKKVWWESDSSHERREQMVHRGAVL